ncbi:hypothetical protein ACET3Z_031955 [Daucus carota]
MASDGKGEIKVNWIEATVSLFSGMYTITIETNDLTVNWKNAVQGLSSHNREMYTLLDLSNNKFSGDVPDSYGNLWGLKLLNLSYNKLSGYIPQSFGDLQSIEALDLSNNNISGTIPQSFSKLDQLSVLDVSNNKLSGEIPRGGQMDTMNDPSYFANNSGLCGMQIRVNCSKDEPPPNDGQDEDDDDEKEPWFLWTGAWIGFPLGLISSVLTAFLDIPEWISTQKNLDILDLSNSSLTGKFPLWLAEMDIKSILLSHNKLTGSIPSRLFQSSSLSILALSKNNFSGELPENIGDAHNIKVLMLSANNLSGAIPKSIADIPELVLLDLSRNKFSGNTFPVFDPNGSLYYGDFSSNELPGEIPVSFCKDTGILALGENKFSGRLPGGLTNMNELEYQHRSTTQFTIGTDKSQNVV